jgi:tripartite-type tricarboxylate transporter receptor subunit TctC
MELFKSMAGVNLSHVPYKGAPQAVADVLAGQVPMMFNSIAPIVQFIKNGRVRVLGISSSVRSPQMPEVPTISEAGVPGYESSTWFAMLAPAKTPRAVIEMVSAAIQSVAREPAIAERLEQLGVEPIGSTAEQMAAIIKAEQPVYAEAVKAAGLGR